MQYIPYLIDFLFEWWCHISRAVAERFSFLRRLISIVVNCTGALRNLTPNIVEAILDEVSSSMIIYRDWSTWYSTINLIGQSTLRLADWKSLRSGSVTKINLESLCSGALSCNSMNSINFVPRSLQKCGGILRRSKRRVAV